MRCCGRSGADFIILLTLFLVTVYSAHSYYTFLFPHTLHALELAFLQPFRRGLPCTPASSSPFPIHLHQLNIVSAKSWILFGVSVILFVFAIWAYVAAVATDPGRVPPAFKQRAPQSATLALKVSGALHMCPVCASYKPQRAHHCSRCGRCVLKYDHHCPWLGGCVGFYNYKLYLLVVLYTFIFTLWVSVLLLVAIGSYVVHHYQIIGGRIMPRNGDSKIGLNDGKCWTELVLFNSDSIPKVNCNEVNEKNISSAQFGRFDACPPFLGVYVCFSEAFIFLLLTASLLKKHWRLARHNLTTLDVVVVQHQLEEGICNIPPLNPYDIGVKGCLHQVFGDGDEYGEHVHPNFIIRWICRLLPFPAYPKQIELPFASTLSESRGLGEAFVSMPPTVLATLNYGTVGTVRRREGGEEDYNSYLLQSSSEIPYLRGMIFPTVSSLSGNALI